MTTPTQAELTQKLKFAIEKTMWAFDQQHGTQSRLVAIIPDWLRPAGLAAGSALETVIPIVEMPAPSPNENIEEKSSATS